MKLLAFPPRANAGGGKLPLPSCEPEKLEPAARDDLLHLVHLADHIRRCLAAHHFDLARAARDDLTSYRPSCAGITFHVVTAFRDTLADDCAEDYRRAAQAYEDCAALLWANAPRLEPVP